MRPLAIVLTCITGCAVEPASDPTLHLPATTTPTFTLYVSNQSFDLPRVDITVRVDGQLAITGDFHVEGQHTWIPFDLDLAPGPHAITIESATGEATLDQAFTMDDRRWAVASFWFYDEDHYEPTPRHFSFDVMDEPPTFQ